MSIDNLCISKPTQNLRASGASNAVDAEILRLQQKYEDVFSEGRGCCSKAKAVLHLRPEIQPVFRPKRPLPYAVLPILDTELKLLEDAEALKPIPPSANIAPDLEFGHLTAEAYVVMLQFSRPKNERLKSSSAGGLLNQPGRPSSPDKSKLMEPKTIADPLGYTGWNRRCNHARKAKTEQPKQEQRDPVLRVIVLLYGAQSYCPLRRVCEGSKVFPQATSKSIFMEAEIRPTSEKGGLEKFGPETSHSYHATLGRDRQRAVQYGRNSPKIKEPGAAQKAPALHTRIRNETIISYSLRHRIRSTSCSRAGESLESLAQSRVSKVNPTFSHYLVGQNFEPAPR
ncbi:hypothetical protein T265_15707, partial [Opisthorchis viverrini]